MPKLADIPNHERPKRKSTEEVSLICHVDDLAWSEYTSADITVGLTANAETIQAWFAPYECRVPSAPASNTPLSGIIPASTSSPCPYHSIMSSQESISASTTDQDPMARFLATTTSHYSAVFTGSIQHDTTPSARCSCINIPEDIVHSLAQTAISLCNEADARPDAADMSMQAIQP